MLPVTRSATGRLIVTTLTLGNAVLGRSGVLVGFLFPSVRLDPGAGATQAALPPWRVGTIDSVNY